jgi:hypothetical protein
MSFFNIVLIFALTFLVSCVIEVKDPPGLRDESVPNAFSAPTVLSLNGVNSIANEQTPSILIEGVMNGYTVKLYSDQCVTEVASGISTSTSISLSSTLLTEGTYTFYAKSINANGVASSCSLANVTYTMDATSPDLTSATVSNSSPTRTTTYNLTYASITGSYSSYCIQENSTVVGSCNWIVGILPASFTTSASQNSKILSIWIQDAAGNMSSRIDTNSVLLDSLSSSAPSALALLVPNSSPYNDPTPTLTVSGVSFGDTVSLYSGSSCSIPSLVASGVASGVTVDLTTSSLSDGAYTFYANSTDPAGNVSGCSSASVNYTLDTVAPELASVTVSNASPTTSSSYNLSFGATTGSFASYCILENSTSLGSCSWTSGVLPASFTVSSTNNAKVLSVWLKDAASNVSSRMDSNSVTLDTSAPSIAITSPANSSYINASTDSSTFTVSGTCSENGRSVIVKIDGSAVTTVGGICNGANFTSTIDSTAYAAGAMSFTAVISDAAGNSTTSSAVGVTRDVTVPTLSGLTNDATARKMKTWTWSCSETCTYQYVIDTSLSTTPSSGFGLTTTDTQASGSALYYIHARAKDAAGNLSLVTHASALLDNTAPTAPSGVSDGNYLASLATSPNITWTASSDANGVDHYEVAIGTSAGASDTKTWATASSGNSIASLSLLSGTTYYSSVRAVDVAGNISSVGQGNGWIADTTLPAAPSAVTLGSVPSSLTTSPTISWTAPSDASGIGSYEVKLFKASDNSMVQDWTALASGGQLTSLSLIVSTNYYVKVRATDNAGNVGTSYGQSSSWLSLPPPCTAANQVFTFTGGNQNVIVPAYCTAATIKAWGAGGGGAGVAQGGGGGFSQATIGVLAAETLIVQVAGGGSKYIGDQGAGGGGGASMVNRSSIPIIIAAGGGGAGASYMGVGGGAGAPGGGLTGLAGSASTCTGGLGGTQSASGAIGSLSGYCAGAVGSTGASFYTTVEYCDEGCWYENVYDFGPSAGGFPNGGYSGYGFYATSVVGGGGGGGYFMGAGGNGNNSSQVGAGGGGGGSSYSTGISQISTAGSGAIAANTGDVDYASNAGAGGAASTNGNPGRVVIIWSQTTVPFVDAPTPITLSTTITNTNQTPVITWTAITGAGGINHYEAQIYKAADDSIIQTWTTLASGGKFTGLFLDPNSSYYIKVRAHDNAGNISSTSGRSANWTAVSCIPGSQTFSYSGSAVAFTVPQECTSIVVKAYGAGGGSGNNFGIYKTGGNGGFAQATLSVSVNESLSVSVGGGGITAGGNFRGAGGGGYSGVFRSATPLIIAGGGGGASPNAIGGHGGGSTATAGANSGCSGGGAGGTPSAGGNGGTAGLGCYIGNNGAYRLGGDGNSACGGYACAYTPNAGGFNGGGAGGGSSWINVTIFFTYSGGGGGGGYWGGGGGSSGDANAAGGGGGSSYVTGTSTTNTNGAGAAGGTTGNGAHGTIVISW